MSHFKTILDQLDALAAVTKAAPKKALLKESLESDRFRRVVVAALHPDWRYNVTSVEAHQPAEFSMPADDEFTVVMDALDHVRATGLRASGAQQALGAHLVEGSPAHTVVTRIVRKDLRCGAGITTVNGAVKGLIPVFKCALAKKYEPRLIKSWPVAVEPKLDGVRCIAVGSATQPFIFYTRSGKEIESVQHIGAQLQATMECFYGGEGELMVFDGEIVTSSFNDTVSQVRRKGAQAADASFHVFDAMAKRTWDAGGGDVDYTARRSALKGLFNGGPDMPNVTPVHQYLVNSDEEVQAIYQSIFDRGGEGVIVKDLAAPYQKKRHAGWLKIKGEETVDCPITGYKPGTGKYENTLGALLVDYKGVEVRVSGMSDAMRTEFWENQDAYLGVMVEVEYHEETPDKSLRHPRLKRLRSDKPVADGVGV